MGSRGSRSRRDRHRTRHRRRPPHPCRATGRPASGSTPGSPAAATRRPDRPRSGRASFVRLNGRVDGDVLDRHAGRQVGDLDAVDERAAFEGDAAPDRVDPRIGHGQPDRHVERQDDPVAGVPGARTRGSSDRPVGGTGRAARPLRPGQRRRPAPGRASAATGSTARVRRLRRRSRRRARPTGSRSRPPAGPCHRRRPAANDAVAYWCELDPVSARGREVLRPRAQRCASRSAGSTRTGTTAGAGRRRRDGRRGRAVRPPLERVDVEEARPVDREPGQDRR